ncbi:protein of unknown function (plasmid) [Cupriavidus taiwanensis]|uniref:Uncharacterized protein n=1 Tax=Cupriavidus taiwanensis TaxID=164546 RepID=A0A9Q7XSK2_9BURK|nr:protein of unknown function [Cupriavidus taiwanensis]
MPHNRRHGPRSSSGFSLSLPINRRKTHFGYLTNSIYRLELQLHVAADVTHHASARQVRLRAFFLYVGTRLIGGI